MKALIFIKQISNQQARNWSLKMNDQELKPLCGKIKEDTYYVVSERPIFGSSDAMGMYPDGTNWFAYEIES